MKARAIEINTGNSGKVLVAVIYEPPNANTNWIYDFVQLLNECSYDKLILLGDFNFPTITIDGSGFCDSTGCIKKKVYSWKILTKLTSA